MQQLITKMRRAWNRLRIAEKRYDREVTVGTSFMFFGWAQTYENLRNQAPSYFKPPWEKEIMSESHAV